MKFHYQAEKLSDARRILMLPHPKGEAESIAGAFHECYLALSGFDKTQLEDNARGWVEKIERLMDTKGLVDHKAEGLYLIKARMLNLEQKMELASCVDELAYWFSETH